MGSQCRYISEFMSFGRTTALCLHFQQTHKKKTSRHEKPFQDAMTPVQDAALGKNESTSVQNQTDAR